MLALFLNKVHQETGFVGKLTFSLQEGVSLEVGIGSHNYARLVVAGQVFQGQEAFDQLEIINPQMSICMPSAFLREARARVKHL